MPIARCYITNVVTTYSFTNQANLVGYIDTTTTHTGSLSVNTVLGVDAKMDFGKIPAGSTVNSITFYVRARSSANSTRAFRAVALRQSTGSATKLNTNETLLTTSDSVRSVTFTRADLTGAGFTDATILDSNNVVEWKFISKSTTSVTTTWTHAWAEVDFTPPAGHEVVTVTLSADTGVADTNQWTTPSNAIAEDNAYATLTKTTAGMQEFYFTSSGVDAIPAEATIKGILFEVDFRVSVTSSSPEMWLKFFSFGESVWTTGTITNTNKRRYIFGSYSNTMARTRQSISDRGNYLRVWQANTTSTSHQIDHIRLQIYYQLPAAGNALFFGENF